MFTKPGLGLVVCALAATTSVASAQSLGQRPGRPYRGLFGVGAADGGDHMLTATFDVGGGYDDSVFSDIGSPTTSDAATWEGGSFGYFGAGLAYEFDRPHVNLAASLSSTTRYYQDQPMDFVSAHVGRVGLSYERRRTRLNLGQTVGYQPFLTFNVFPALIDPELGEAHPADQNQGSPLDAYLSYDTTAEVTHDVSRRGSLVFSYAYRFVDFEEEDRDSAIHSVAGRYQREVRRDLSVRAGYGYSEARYPETSAVDDVGRHTIDVGVDYNRALSVSRRTTFSFQTGGAVISDGELLHYSFIGSARLQHEMGRTWSAGVAYHRNVAFLESLVDPYFSDALSAGLTGVLAPRLTFDAYASASTGTIGFADTGNDGLITYSTNVGLSFGLTRLLALDGRYSYYHYAFESDVDLPTGLASRVGRQSVGIFLNLWLPLLGNPRSLNASR